MKDKVYSLDDRDGIIVKTMFIGESPTLDGTMLRHWTPCGMHFRNLTMLLMKLGIRVTY